MPKPTFLISILFFCYGIANAQYGAESGNIENDSRSANESGSSVFSEQSNLKPPKILGFENHVGGESYPDFGNEADLSEYLIDADNKEKYMASLKIANLLWRGNPGSRLDDRNDLFVIGVKKPDYSISRRPYIKGILDFRLGGSVFGIENRVLIAISYYLKTENSLEGLSSAVSFERLSFSLSIPFGKGK